jgi:hypothetical protein
MGVNNDKPELWAVDIACSMGMFNDWFMTFPADVYRDARRAATTLVRETLELTKNVTVIAPEVILSSPPILKVLRMITPASSGAPESGRAFTRY